MSEKNKHKVFCVYQLTLNNNYVINPILESHWLGTHGSYGF